MLIILGGLPGVGKTTLSRAAAQRLAATHLRIDSIEQAMRESSAFGGGLQDAGYRVAYAVAADNLRLGLRVLADSVNPIAVTRNAWRQVAERAGVRAVEIEIICSDTALHRQRVESRAGDSAGLVLPTWQEVTRREYEPWGADLVVDTAHRSVEQCVEQIVHALRAE